MYQVATEIDIEAEPQGVWTIIMDFPAYPDWNPFIRRISGTPSAGSRLTISVKPPNGRAVTIRPVVVTCIENRELRWRGRLGVAGIFDREHFLRIDSQAPGRVRFTHGERFTGVLIPFCRRFLEGAVRAGFMEMNQALKSRAEHR